MCAFIDPAVNHTANPRYFIVWFRHVYIYTLPHLLFLASLGAAVFYPCPGAYMYHHLGHFSHRGTQIYTLRARSCNSTCICMSHAPAYRASMPEKHGDNHLVQQHAIAQSNLASTPLAVTQQQLLQRCIRRSSLGIHASYTRGREQDATFFTYPFACKFKFLLVHAVHRR